MKALPSEEVRREVARNLGCVCSDCDCRVQKVCAWLIDLYAEWTGLDYEEISLACQDYVYRDSRAEFDRIWGEHDWHPSGHLLFDQMTAARVKLIEGADARSPAR